MSGGSSFSCGEALDIVHVEGLRQRLQKSLAKSSSIELKAHLVSKADTAGLQLFIALNQHVHALGGSLNWKKPSPTLVHAAKLLGVTQAIGLPESE